MQVWIGCSGFHYKHWVGTFYPAGLPQRKWFDYYSEHFNTLELNVTFYRFPRPQHVEDWYNRSPSKFCFSVKAPKAITHYKQFYNTERMLGDFYQTIKEGLKEKLGAVLFQLPGRLGYTQERLERIVACLDPTFSNVLEFRNTSWWNHDVYHYLHKHNIAFCGMSHPEFSTEVVRNVPLVYYRFHGIPELYKSPYSLKELKKFTQEVLLTKGINELYVYFNNDIGTAAIDNAKQLLKLFNKALEPTPTKRKSPSKEEL